MPAIIAILAGQQQSTVGDFALQDSAPRAYAEAILAAGGAPLLVPVLQDETIVAALLDRADGLLVTGGADLSPDLFGQQPLPALGSVTPLRDRVDQIALHLAAARELPVLGVCRGIQSMAVFAGGTLIQDIPSQVPGAIQHGQKAPGWHGTHEIEIEPESLLAQLTGRPRAMVNSFHHQAVQDMPPGFVATARTADGVIEAIEKPALKFHLGLQFHPELMAARHDCIAGIFRGFVAAAADAH
jgi:putative glutamine amidotransferase